MTRTVGLGMSLIRTHFDSNIPMPMSANARSMSMVFRLLLWTRGHDFWQVSVRFHSVNGK